MAWVKVWLIWLNYLVRGLLGRRRYVGLTPPSFRRQRVYDRREGRSLHFAIRDDDDWIQIEHIFLNDEFDLAKTGRMAAIEQYYRSMVDRSKTPLILDLGANIGLASAYFHEIWPQARIISVEPNAGNCIVARDNLPSSATLVEAAVGSSTGSIGLIDTGRNCGFQVDTGTGGDIPLVTVNQLLQRAPDTEPFLVKIDIEGFEEDLFSKDLDWIDRFPILLIELHDWMLPGKRVTRNFVSAMAARERELIHFNGYVVSLAAPL